MIKILLLTMLVVSWVPAQGAADECTAVAKQREFSRPFGIDIADSWVKKDMGELTTYYHPNRNGILRVQSQSTPSTVDKERLRILTNVDRSTPLAWQDWGEFSGYQHAYWERGIFFRQWWLINKCTIIFVVYESSVELAATDIDELNRIVNSLTVNES